MDSRLARVQNRPTGIVESHSRAARIRHGAPLPRARARAGLRAARRCSIDGSPSRRRRSRQACRSRSSRFSDPAPTRHLSALAERTAQPAPAYCRHRRRPLGDEPGPAAVRCRRDWPRSRRRHDDRPGASPSTTAARALHRGRSGPRQRRRHRPGRRSVRRYGHHRRRRLGRSVRMEGLRGSMGSIFRLPIAVQQPLPESIAARATRRHAGLRHRPARRHVPRGLRLRAPVAILLGGEGAGVPDEMIGRLTSDCHDTDAAARRIAQRRDRRRADSATKHSARGGSTDVAVRRPGARKTRADRIRRRWPSGCARARSTSSSARTRSLGPGRPLREAIEHDRLQSIILWGPPGTGKTTLARLIATRDARAVRLLQRGARRHQGDPDGDDRGGRGPPATRQAHDPVRRRDPSLQQGAAGRVPAARRSGRHRADRRDDREPVVRGELGAALAVEGLRAQAARAGRDS